MSLIVLPFSLPSSLSPIRSSSCVPHGTRSLRSHPDVVGKTAIDRAAANRFIKHAIAQAKGQPQQRTPGEAPAQSDGAPAHTHIRFDENGNAPSGSSSASTSSSTPVTQIPVKVTSKMLARAEYQKKLAEGDASSDGDDADGLAVIDGESESEGEAQSERMSLKAKGKAKATNKEGASPSGAKKRRRPASDPFAGSYRDSRITGIR